MAQGVVDGLEPVQIQKPQGKRARWRQVNILGHPSVEKMPVGQPGDRVVVGQVTDAVFLLVGFGGIGYHADMVVRVFLADNPADAHLAVTAALAGVQPHGVLPVALAVQLLAQGLIQGGIVRVQAGQQADILMAKQPAKPRIAAAQRQPAVQNGNAVTALFGGALHQV